MGKTAATKPASLGEAGGGLGKPFHISVVRSRGTVAAVQLRRGAGGPGQSWYFALSKFGGTEQSARRAARRHIRQLGGEMSKGLLGARKKDTPSAVPGIRFEWKTGRSGEAWGQVVVTYPPPSGMRRKVTHVSKKRSCEKHGLQEIARWAVAERKKHAGVKTSQQEVFDRLVQWYWAGPR